jgi:hypothetical protein
MAMRCVIVDYNFPGLAKIQIVFANGTEEFHIVFANGTENIADT